MEAFALYTVVLHDNAGASNDLAWIAFTIDLAKTGPGTKDLSVSDLDEVDFVFGAESLDEFEIFGFRAGLDENAKVGLALVKGLGALTKTACKTIVQESVLQNLLETRRRKPPQVSNSSRFQTRQRFDPPEGLLQRTTFPLERRRRKSPLRRPRLERHLQRQTSWRERSLSAWQEQEPITIPLTLIRNK